MATEIGVILVHGIGEQGRFEHLDNHIRGIIQGIRRTGATTSVEIMSSTTASFQAVQDSWRSGPHAALRIVVRTADGAMTHINVHEVWWADINERYSVMKQVRFWLWGLSIWLYPRKPSTELPTSCAVFVPRTKSPWLHALPVRLRLFGLGWFFLLSSLTVGIGTVLLKRLLNIESSNLVRTFANYLSSIKLYNQRRRSGPGLQPSGADFLDTIGEPPRVSIRRRMIRTIADVALHKYDRWYILAHSQGSVVAFNGLMEPAFGWPGYLDERRWRRLIAHGFAGPAIYPAPNMDNAIPARPLWADPNDIAYRQRIFSRFHGILTYGCPLEKFAAIWPARVPVCREKAFRTGTRWLNVYDPLDPVSGVMMSWPTRDPEYCPAPETVGYATHPLLLAGHLAYMLCPVTPSAVPPPAARNQLLADGVAHWLLTDKAEAILDSDRRNFFRPGSWRARRRHASATLQWGGAFTLSVLVGAWFVPWIIRPVASSLIRTPLPVSLQAPSYKNAVIGTLLVTGIVTLLGGIMRNLFFGGRRNFTEQDGGEAFSGIPSPEPPPP